jgi:hypothetical protein
MYIVLGVLYEASPIPDHHLDAAPAGLALSALQVTNTPLTALLCRHHPDRHRQEERHHDG